MYARVLSHFSRVRLFATLWTVARQAPLSTGFSRQESWSGLPCPPPGNLPNPGIKPASLTSADRFFTAGATWKVCYSMDQFSSVAQTVSSVAQSCPTLCNPWNAAFQGSLSFTIFCSLLKFMSIELMPFNHLIFCRPLLLLPSILPRTRVFSKESALCIRWPKYWSFSFSISPSKEYSGFISFRIDFFDLLEVQGTLKSLLQHHSSKALILWCSDFFGLLRWFCAVLSCSGVSNYL